MNHWIFVINDTSEVFEKRMKEERWPIFVRTHNRKHLHAEDAVVFYKAGTDGKKFLGTAKIITELTKSDKIDFSLGIDEINIWEKSKSVDSLIENLDFIKDKRFWGRFFQGGVIKMSKKDFTTITRKL